jgi:hypothetical protein
MNFIHKGQIKLKGSALYHPLLYKDEAIYSKTRSVPHCGLAIYIQKHLKAKEELWKLKYFTMPKKKKEKKKPNLQKNHLKETKILQDIITL